MARILIEFFWWYGGVAPLAILKGWGNILAYNLNSFSVFLLAKTFFAPWRRYVWSYPRGFDFGKYAEVFASNLISRIIGAIVRLFLIGIGLAVEASFIVLGFVFLIFWIAWPVLAIFSFFYGIGLLL